MVRSHLEYANCIWSPYTVQDIKTLEKVQMRATKLIKRIKHLSYMERLKYLNLPTLHYRRLRGDMIMVYKICSGIYDSNTACLFVKPTNTITRGHNFRLFKGHVLYDLRKYNFCNRIISIWNSLPSIIVNASSIRIFENKLDRLWRDQECYFDYKSELTGIGSRSQL